MYRGKWIFYIRKYNRLHDLYWIGSNLKQCDFRFKFPIIQPDVSD
jgi:hypothetical protein